MKTLTTLFVALALAVATPAFAGKNAAAKRQGKAGKGKDKAARPALVLKKLDANHNGQIDGDETAALKDALAKAGADSPLKKIDRNSNGQLDDKELAAINKRLGKHAGKKDKAGRKSKKTAV